MDDDVEKDAEKEFAEQHECAFVSVEELLKGLFIAVQLFKQRKPLNSDFKTIFSPVQRNYVFRSNLQ